MSRLRDFHIKQGINTGETITMGVTVALFLIGAAAAFAAILGVVRGSVYCKGGPYSRATQPVTFWMAIVVYALWSLAMGYLAFFRS